MQKGVRRVYAPPGTRVLMQVHTEPPGRKHDPRAHKRTHTASPRRSHPRLSLLFFFLPFSFLFPPFPRVIFCSYVSDTAPPCSFPASRFIDQTVYLAARTCTVHFRIILFLSNQTYPFAVSRHRFIGTGLSVYNRDTLLVTLIYYLVV